MFVKNMTQVLIYDCQCGAWVKVFGEELIPPPCPICNQTMSLLFYGQEEVDKQLDLVALLAE